TQPVACSCVASPAGCRLPAVVSLFSRSFPFLLSRFSAANATRSKPRTPLCAFDSTLLLLLCYGLWCNFHRDRANTINATGNSRRSLAKKTTDGNARFALLLSAKKCSLNWDSFFCACPDNRGILELAGGCKGHS
ncbi:unnamed protein product, partial [Callosobruchus maculatus]